MCVVCVSVCVLKKYISIFMFIYMYIYILYIGGHEQIDVRVSASIVFSMLGRCYGRRMPGLCSLSRSLCLALSLSLLYIPLDAGVMLWAFAR